MPSLAQPCDGLDPAEVARMPRGPFIDGATAVRTLLSDMRSDRLFPQLAHKIPRVRSSWSFGDVQLRVG
jgi:hypothetical protein